MYCSIDGDDLNLVGIRVSCGVSGFELSLFQFIAIINLEHTNMKILGR
jgi:hypothetical protein